MALVSIIPLYILNHQASGLILVKYSTARLDAASLALLELQPEVSTTDQPAAHSNAFHIQLMHLLYLSHHSHLCWACRRTLDFDLYQTAAFSYRRQARMLSSSLSRMRGLLDHPADPGYMMRHRFGSGCGSYPQNLN